jgi:hypothetical protein
MNVLVLPEDFRNDQYVLRPIIQALFRYRGLQAKIQILTDPLLGGVDEALNQNNIESILDLYKGMVDIFILCVDRDCEAGRHISLKAIEQYAAARLPAGKRFLAAMAMEELEVWLLAGVNNLPADWRWRDILDECHPKELYFDEYVKLHGLQNDVGRGRRMLGLNAARNYQRVRQLCSRDVQVLEAAV